MVACRTQLTSLRLRIAPALGHLCWPVVGCVWLPEVLSEPLARSRSAPAAVLPQFAPLWEPAWTASAPQSLPACHHEDAAARAPCMTQVCRPPPDGSAEGGCDSISGSRVRAPCRTCLKNKLKKNNNQKTLPLYATISHFISCHVISRMGFFSFL